MDGKTLAAELLVESPHRRFGFVLSSAVTSSPVSVVQELVGSLGAHKFDLTTVGSGFFVCNLRRLNKVLELKPNVAGLGINLNAAIEALLPPEARPI